MSNPVIPLGSFIIREITIPNAGTESTKVNISGMSLVGIYFPAMSGTQAHVYACDTIDGTFVSAYHSYGATQSTITVASSPRYVSLNPNADTTGINNVQIVAATTQAAERTIKLVLKGI